MVVAEPATGVVPGAETAGSDRAQMKSVYWLALFSFLVLPFIGTSFSGQRWGILASVVVGGGCGIIALVLMYIMFVSLPGGGRRLVIAAAVAIVLRYGIAFLPIPLAFGAVVPALAVVGVVVSWFFARRLPGISYCAVILAPLIYFGLSYPVFDFLYSLNLDFPSGKTTIIFAVPYVVIPAIAMVAAVLVGTLLARIRTSRTPSPLVPTEEAHE